MRQSLWNLFKLAIGIGLLIFLYTRLEDPAFLWRQVASASMPLLLVGACSYASAVALNGVKWGILLRTADIRVRLGQLMAYQWLAEFFNNFLPAQIGGDVMRGYALATDTRRRADAAASVLIDRFIGLLIFMLSAALGAWSMILWGRPSGIPFAPEEMVSVRLIALGSGGVTLLLIVLLAALLSRRLKRLMEVILARLPFTRVTGPIWAQLATAFNVYRYEYRAMALTALGSVLIVLLTSINIWLIARAIQPDSISLLEVLTINPILVFVGLVLPLSPGGLGVRQSAFAATFLLIGAGSSVGLAMDDLGFAVGVLQQLIGYVVSLPGGYLWVRGSRNRRVAQAQAQAEPASTEPAPTDI